MPKCNNIIGKRYGRLRVIEKSGRANDRHILWRCVCDCGKEVIVMGRDLVNGHSKSCGCLQKETISRIRYKHGDRDARLYNIWSSMKNRCENVASPSYKYYGEKGVSVCQEWHDYRVFRKWALDNGYNSDAPFGVCTIDRINPYGNYNSENCRWVSADVQRKNKRKNYDMPESKN